MTINRRKSIAMLSAMLGTAALAAWARPTIHESDSRPGFKLDDMIPLAFGDWQIDHNMPVIVPPPDQQAALSRIYNQILARSYVNSAGYRIMLSLAYGGDQSDGLTVHLPEICYVGQGFKLEQAGDSRMLLGGLNIPVRRLITSLGQRHEPITYWVTYGDEATNSAWRRRVVGFNFGLRRRIPDGLLVRVSSIDRNDVYAYHVQDAFLIQLVGAMTLSKRNLLIGTSSPPAA